MTRTIQKALTVFLLSSFMLAASAPSAFAECLEFDTCNPAVSGTTGNGTVSVPGSCNSTSSFDVVSGFDSTSSPADLWELTDDPSANYTDIFLYAEEGYRIDFLDTFSTSVSFDLIHFNDSDVEISVYGVRLDGTKGYLTDSSGTALNAITYAPSGVAEGSRYTVSIPLEIDFSTPAFQSVQWIRIEPLGREGGLIDACVN